MANRWQRYRKGTVQHLVLSGYGAPYLACRQEGGGHLVELLEIEPDDLSDSPNLPRCKSCLKTNEWRLHDEATDHDGHDS